MRKSNTDRGSGNGLPPHDKDAERAVLGQALLTETIPQEAESLGSKDFYSPLHSEAWAAMKQLAAEGIRVDLISLKNVLAKRAEPATVDRVAADLAQILDDRWSASNLSYYVEIIKTKAAQRA